MMDALTLYDFFVSMRHAGYLSFAAAVLGLAEAHYPGLRQAALRATEWPVRAWRGTMRRSSVVQRCCRSVESRPESKA